MGAITQYVPHMLVAAVATVTTYVFKDHVKRDDTRFADIKTDYQRIDDKLDAHYTNLMTAISNAASAASAAAAAAQAALDKR